MSASNSLPLLQSLRLALRAIHDPRTPPEDRAAATTLSDSFRQSREGGVAWFEIISRLLLDPVAAPRQQDQVMQQQLERHFALQVVLFWLRSGGGEEEMVVKVKVLLLGLVGGGEQELGLTQGVVRDKLAECVAELIVGRRVSVDDVLTEFQRAITVGNVSVSDIAFRTIRQIAYIAPSSSSSNAGAVTAGGGGKGDMSDDEEDLDQRRPPQIASLSLFFPWLVPAMRNLLEQFLALGRGGNGETAVYLAKQCLVTLETLLQYKLVGGSNLENIDVDLLSRVISSHPEFSEIICACFENLASITNKETSLVPPLLKALADPAILALDKRKHYAAHKSVANALNLTYLYAGQICTDGELGSLLFKTMLLFSSHPSVIILDSLIPAWKIFLPKRNQRKEVCLLLPILADSTCISISDNDELTEYFEEDGYDLDDDEQSFFASHTNHVMELIDILAKQFPEDCISFLELRYQVLRTEFGATGVEANLKLRKLGLYLKWLPLLTEKILGPAKLKISPTCAILQLCFGIYYAANVSSPSSDSFCEGIVHCVRGCFEIAIAPTTYDGQFSKCLDLFFTALTSREHQLPASRALRDSGAQALRDWCTRLNDPQDQNKLSILSQLLPLIIERVLTIMRSNAALPQEMITLFETLVIASNALQDPNAKRTLLDDIIRDSLVLIASPQVVQIVSSPTVLVTTLLSPPSAPMYSESTVGTSGSAAIENDLTRLPLILQNIRTAFRILIGVAKASAPSPRKEMTQAGESSFDHRWPDVLPIAATLIQSLQAIWQDPNIQQQLGQEIASKLTGIYPAEIRYLFGHDHPLVQYVRTKTEKQQWLASSSWLAIMRDLLYALIGFSAESGSQGLFRKDANQFLQNVLQAVFFANKLENMENRHLTKVIHAILASLITHCPAADRGELLNRMVLPIVQHISFRLEQSNPQECWNPRVILGDSETNSSVTNEWISELNIIVLNHLAMAQVDLLKVCFGNIQGMENESFVASLLVCFAKQIVLPWANSCNKAILMCREIILALVNTQASNIHRQILSTYFLPATLHALLRPKCKLNDGAQLALIDIFTEIYCLCVFQRMASQVVSEAVATRPNKNSKQTRPKLQPIFDAVLENSRAFCETIPGVTRSMLETYEEKLVTVGVSEKKQRSVTRDFLTSCFRASGVSNDDSILSQDRSGPQAKAKQKSASFKSTTNGDWTQATDAWDLGVLRLFSQPSSSPVMRT